MKELAWLLEVGRAGAANHASAIEHWDRLSSFVVGFRYSADPSLQF